MNGETRSECREREKARDNKARLDDNDNDDLLVSKTLKLMDLKKLEEKKVERE